MGSNLIRGLRVRRHWGFNHVIWYPPLSSLAFSNDCC